MFDCSAVVAGSSQWINTCKKGALGQDHSTDKKQNGFKSLSHFLAWKPLVCFLSWCRLWDACTGLSGEEVTFRSHWKCRVATDKLTCRGISRCSFRLLQTQQLEHAWALPHKGALQRRPINLPKASKSKKEPVWAPKSGARGPQNRVLGRLCGVSLGPRSNKRGWDKGTGWRTCAL